jgi:hypothetical protein
MSEQVPHANPGKNCHHNGQDMSKVCHKCPLWIKIEGTHPQNEQVRVDRWDCADAWQPILMLENAKLIREVGAAVESLRNEVVDRSALEEGLRVMQQRMDRMLETQALPHHQAIQMLSKVQNGA